MPPVVSDLENAQIILKLQGFSEALDSWIRDVIFQSFFGEQISIETGWRIKNYIEGTFHEFLKDFPSISGFKILTPERDEEAVYLDLVLEFGIHQTTTSIRIGQKISHDFDF